MPDDIPTMHARSPFQDALGNERPSSWPHPCCPAFNSGGKWSFTKGGWPPRPQHGVGLFSSFRGLDSSVSLSLAGPNGDLWWGAPDSGVRACYMAILLCFCRPKVGAQLQVCPKGRGGPVRLRPGVPSKGSWVGSHGMLDPGYNTRVCSAEIWMVRWAPCDPRRACSSGWAFWGLLRPMLALVEHWVQLSSANPPESLQKQ